MSTPSIQQSTTGFAALPREIRDMIFWNIASSAEITVDSHDSYYLLLPQYWERGNDYTDCIIMLHEWAPKSYIAKAACEVLWSYGTFHHGWYFKSEAIIDPRETLYIQTGLSERKSVGTPIDLRECVRDLQLYTNPMPHSYAEPTELDTQSLLKLQRELSQLHEFPHLRRVHLEIWLEQECDAYSEGMAIVESILEAFKELRARIGTGLLISLCRTWPYDLEKFKYIEQTNIEWMWKPPSREERNRVEQGVATTDQWIRVLIADGVGPKAEYTLLEELLYACETLPQEKDELAAMESWEPWTGISEDEFKDIKEHWGKDEE